MTHFMKIFLSFLIFLTILDSHAVVEGFSVDSAAFKNAALNLTTSLIEEGGYSNVKISTNFDHQDLDQCLLKSDHQVIFDLSLEYQQYLSSFHFRNFKDVFEYKHFYVCKETAAIGGDFKNGYAITHSLISAYDSTQVQIYFEYLR